MRSGACTLQQTLTSEAASVLKHSLGLARRRGHAQVTPLHVAATLLSLRASSLRRACLKSQPHSHLQSSHHPLQCRALELCFNVALNRLPTTTPGGPLLHHHSQPSLSNALIAALKRAQAHQRRGCIEQQQQQPLLTIKVELEQLIISILDDPSVSRVMREAGFSSTAVKSNIEDSSSSAPPNSVFYNSSGHGGGVFSSPCSPATSENHNHNHSHNHFLAAYSPAFLCSPLKKASSVFPISEPVVPSFKEDIKVVLDVLLRKKKKNTVIVGDSVSLTEGLVGELMGRLERGEVPDELKSAHFIKFQFAPVSLRFMKREEVEMNLSALKRKVDSAVSSGGGGGGAIFYVGDLKWTVEATFSENEVSGYNPVDHLVAEIAKMFCEMGNSNTKVWLVATASYQTYMRCQMRQPPLETQWGLQAVPVPSGGLGLTLNASSVHDSKMTFSQNPSHMLEKKLFSDMEEQDNLNCCEECASNYEKEAQLFKPGQNKLLPSWLQSHSTEAHQKDELTQLKKKWNRLCQSLHQNKQPQNHWSNTLLGRQGSNGKIYPYNSSYPLWPNQGSSAIITDSSSISFADSAAAKPSYSSSGGLVPRFRRQQSCSTIEFNFSDVTQKKQSTTITLDSLKGKEEGNNEVKISLALGNSSTFGGSGGKSVTTLRQAHICKLLQENVPWQSETTVASIAEALVDSKSSKQGATWLFLQGNDSVGKTRLARAIAESVFATLLHFDMWKMEKNSAKPVSEILAAALKTNEEQLVLLIENVDFADAQFRKSIEDGFEAAKFGSLSQAIFILTNGGTRINEEQNNDSVVKLVLQISETKPTLESSHKRRAELDLFTKINKSPRIEEKEETVFDSEQSNNKKKDFSRQSSFNTLDLNMKADEEEDDGEDISSDLTRETIADPFNTNENLFELNQSEDKERKMEEVFLWKMKECFEEVFGIEKVGSFTVEERVIEEIGVGCGSFTNSMFEKWLKDIFQSSLQTVNFGGGKGGIVFTLCGGGKEDTTTAKSMDSGFMSSCLPNNIQVNYFMD